MPTNPSGPPVTPFPPQEPVPCAVEPVTEESPTEETQEEETE